MRCWAVCTPCRHPSALPPPPWSGPAPGSAPPPDPPSRRRHPGSGWAWPGRAPESWREGEPEWGRLSPAASRGSPLKLICRSRGGRPQASWAQAAPTSCAVAWCPRPARPSWCRDDAGDWCKEASVRHSPDSPWWGAVLGERTKHCLLKKLSSQSWQMNALRDISPPRDKVSLMLRSQMPNI